MEFSFIHSQIVKATFRPQNPTSSQPGKKYTAECDKIEEVHFPNLPKEQTDPESCDFLIFLRILTQFFGDFQ